MSDNPALLAIRKEIDAIDYQLHDLINLRAEKALAIAKIKVQENREHTRFYRPEREAQILQQITEYNQGPLSATAIAQIFRVIMQECRNLQITRMS